MFDELAEIVLGGFRIKWELLEAAVRTSSQDIFKILGKSELKRKVLSFFKSVESA